jgi:iron complex transport system ATP-binding protein
MSESLAARSATFRIGAKPLLQDATFALEPGQLCGMVGLNGAGKSTLLRCLAGDIRVSSGDVELNGHPLHQWPRRERARRIAVLSQETQIDFPLTVFDVVLLGRAPHVHLRESKRDYEIVLETLDMMEVAHLAEREYPTLSGGEKQRVQLARVLTQLWREPDAPAGEARYLLLDEPTSSLDLIHQHRTMQIVLGIAAGGVGILVILHDLNLASRYTHQLLVLKEGRIVAKGPTQDLLKASLIRDAFGLHVHLVPHPAADHYLVVPR